MSAPAHYNIQLVNCSSLGDFEQQLQAAAAVASSHELAETASVEEAAEAAAVAAAVHAENETTVLEHVEVVGAVGQEELQRVWSRASTLMLINVYKDFIAKFNSRKYRKKTLWVEITEQLQQMGLKFQPVQVEGRWKTLNAAYRKALVRRSAASSSSSERRSCCLFFNELHGILGDRAKGAVAAGGEGGNMAAAASGGGGGDGSGVQFDDGAVSLIPVDAIPTRPPPSSPSSPSCPSSSPPGTSATAASDSASNPGRLGSRLGGGGPSVARGLKRRRTSVRVSGGSGEPSAAVAAAAADEAAGQAAPDEVVVVGLGDEVGALLREIVAERREADRRRSELALRMHQDRMKALGAVLEVFRGLGGESGK